MDGVVAYILGKSYVKKSLIGIGALAGAPCQVQSINKVGKTTTITLKWEDNLGGIHTQAFNIEDGLDGTNGINGTDGTDGADGVSVVNAVINEGGHLILTLSNGNTIDCGKVIAQFTTMPPASPTYVGTVYQYIGSTGGGYTSNYFYKCINDGGTYKWVNIKVQEGEDIFRYTTMPPATSDINGRIIQYIGVTDTDYTNGYFYQCVNDGGIYKWVQKNIQPSGGGTGGDGVVDGYYNSTNHLFYEDSSYSNPITGNSDTIYVSLDTNLLYRYDSDNSIFIRVDESSVGEDDVIDGYYNTTDHKFYKEPSYTTEIIGQTGKIYISDDTNIQYRWDGTQFVTISSSITVDNALSTTSTNPVQNKVITVELNDLKGTVIKKSDIDNALSTTSENPVQNKVVTAAIQDLQASKLSIIDIDNALSATSLNPVQNKVITLELDALKGSVLNSIRKKIAATADDFAIFTNDGDIKDSGISKNIVPTTASVSNKLLVATDLSIKADKVSGATNDDIALLDSTGNLKDSGKKLSDYQEKLTEGNGIDIDTNNVISVDISYLTATKLGYIPTSEKGTSGGVAELDVTGKVPSSQLPSYVDDVIDGYYKDADGKFYKENTYTTEIVGESGKIYISLDTNIQYRWTGTAFAALGGALQLGETSSTAYRGDRGKIAYDHSQIKDGSNPHETTADNVNLKVPIPALSGTKLDVESTLYGINTELGNKQPKTLSVPISTLGGTMLTVEDTLNEFNTEIKGIDTDLDGKADLTDLAPEFDNNVAYNKGQYVTYNGDIYKFTADHAIGAWVGTDATQIIVSNEIIGTTHLYDYNGTIANGDDLNDYKTIGNYECPNMTVASSLSNSPVTTAAFSLQVTIRGRNLFPDSSTQPTLQQIIKNINNNSSDIWIRTLTYNGSAWGEWKKLATTYQEEIVIASETTTSTYRNAYIKISGIPTNNASLTKPISLLLGTSRANRYILNITPYYNNSTVIKLQAINISGEGIGNSDILADLAYELSSTTAVGTMDIWLRIYLNTRAIRLNFSDISNIASISYNIALLGNDNDIYDVSTSTTNSDYFDTLTKGIISNVAYQEELNDKLSYADNSILGAKNLNATRYIIPANTYGITWTVNDDGTIGANGTNDGTNYSTIGVGRDYAFVFNYPSGNYIVSGGIDSDAYVYVVDRTGGSANIIANSIVSDTVVSFEKGRQYTLSCYIEKNKTVNNVIFKPMLRLATDTDGNYQPPSLTNQELTKFTTWKDV